MRLPLPSRAGALTAGYFATVFLAIGAHLPFWPVWLAEWGLSGAEIGAYSAAAVAARILTGLCIPMLAEWIDQRRLTLAILALITALLMLAHLEVADRTLLLLLTIGVSVSISGVLPLADALGNAAAVNGGFGYARARAFGSFAFVFANLALGALVMRFGVDAALWWIVAAMLGSVPLALHHPGGGKAGRANRLRWEMVRALAADRVFLVFAVTVAALQASHGIFFALGSVHWRELGIGEGTIGLLWAGAVMAETVLMLVAGPWLVARLGPVGALALAGGAGVLRWGLMGFDPAVWALWPLQGLHALTFAAGHIGMMAFFQAAVPVQLWATGIGFVVQLLGNSVMAAVMAVGGAAYPEFGGATYGVAALLAAAGLGLAAVLARLWDGGPIRLPAAPAPA
ncbi:MAG TPA: MFS transporter [Paracoccaceae bacterium]|nr:MFS transporter [Paracoccaceae bacterium]